MGKKNNKVKFPSDTATEAALKYQECATLRDGILMFTSALKGKIKSVRWAKYGKGVGETIKIIFPDTSGIQITKFVQENGQSQISIKRED